MKIEGKLALVTGGAAGLGKALTLRLLESGAKFVAIIDFNEEAGQEVASEFNRKFGDGRVMFIRCDVTKEADLKKCFQEAYDVHDYLDIVVNNAGIISSDHQKTIAVNLVAVMNGMLIAADLMTKKPRSEKGVIINTASMAGFLASPVVNFSYTASKYGVVGLTKSFPNSTDGFSKDLRAVAICPAVVDTSLWTSNGFSTNDVKGRLETIKDRYVTVDMVIDAFIHGIENDELNGAFVKVRKEGIDVEYS
ncbi:15-hydroxyprostaglandin dehydrogenase [NAD(+)]-like [Apostichopus japonicus]|uniref:15-hydroxyprostaglandin dehydrogenase [NAD(+)]-like n=1 Tax=Stichopus japonicus TaxID=307972 RepID=UPI003AB69BED